MTIIVIMNISVCIFCSVVVLFKNNKISVKGKSNKRPFIHINDVVQSYQLVVAADKEKIGGQIFNVGSEEQNYEMGNLANEITNNCEKKCEIELSDTNDYRSYFASFQKIKEAVGDATITVISVGNDFVMDVMKKPLSMGADQMILVQDPATENLDALGTATVLSKAIEKIGQADIVICGQQASDCDNAHVPMGISEMLGMA